MISFRRESSFVHRALLSFAVALSVAGGAVSVFAQGNAVPLVNEPLDPASVVPGSKGFTLKVRGTGFAPGAVLNWNASQRLTIVDSSSHLHASISASDVASAGTASITVTNPAPGGGTSNVVYLTIRDALSTVAFARKDRSISFYGGITSGDFNNDGKLDIAVGQGSGLDVYLGKGDGTFRAPITTGTQAGSIVVSTGDFNGDGNLDVAVSSEQIGILLGDGTGHFTPMPPVEAADNGDYLAVADFNGDGKLDLFSSGFGEEGDSRFKIYLGNGDGTFHQAGSDYFLLYFFQGPAIGDFNGDGVLDFALPGGLNEDIYLGNGDGTFQNPVAFPSANAGTSVATADVSGDGKLDLVTDGVSVLLGKGDGTFKSNGGVNTGDSSFFTYANDMNGDGKVDIALVSIFENRDPSPMIVTLLLGNGDGSFQNPLTFDSGLLDNTFGDLQFALGDFNNDGLMDLVDMNSNAVTSQLELSVFLQTTASISPSSVDFGKQQVGQKSTATKVTLTNVGVSPLPIQSIGIKGANAKNFSQTNKCGASLNPGDGCTIKVFFKPSDTGNKSALLKIADGGAGSPQSAQLTGIGVNSQVSLKPSKLDFPLQLVGTQSSPQTATLTNVGTEIVTISKVSTTGPFEESNNCGSSLNPGASCQVQVQFVPTDPGDASGRLTVSDSALDSPQTVQLTGLGTIVKLSPISINFGNQPVGTTSPSVPVTLTNKGNVTLNISAIQIVGANASDFAQTNNCGNSLPAGSTCKIKVTFAPTALGARAASLSISDDGGGSPQTVALAGTGT